MIALAASPTVVTASLRGSSRGIRARRTTKETGISGGSPKDRQIPEGVAADAELDRYQ
jgi:hypothetical protein